MNDKALDPRLEKLVGMLYGELGPAEEQSLRSELETDAELRREWEELNEGHAFLERLEDPVAPGFVFLHEATPASPREERAPWWKRAFGDWGAAPVWAATAAVLLLAFVAVTDMNVRKTDGGLALKFGEPAVPQGYVQLPSAGSTAGGADLGGATLQQAAYLTPQDMETYEARMIRLFGAMLQDYRRYQDRELSGVVQAAVNELAFRQEMANQGLRDRIDALGVGVTQSQGDMELRFHNLEQSQKDPVPPSQKEN